MNKICTMRAKEGRKIYESLEREFSNLTLKDGFESLEVVEGSMQKFRRAELDGISYKFTQSKN